MKKLLLYLPLAILFFSTENIVAQDKITNVTAPNQVSPGHTITVSVEYNISKSREILVNVQENGGEWKSYAWVRAKAKSNKSQLEIEVPVSSEIPIAIDAYKIGVSLVPIGKSYPDRIDQYTKVDIDAVNGTAIAKAKEESSQLDDIISISAPEQLTPGQTINIDVDYNASKSRDLLVNLTLNKAPWTNYGSTKVSVPAGEGTQKITLTISSDIPLANDSYNLAVAIVPNNKSWPDRLDNLLKGEIDAVSAISEKEERQKKNKRKR